MGTALRSNLCNTMLDMKAFLCFLCLSSAVGKDEYTFGPCEGPDPSRKFDTDVYGKVLAADGTLEWWPSLREKDIAFSDKKTNVLTVKCSSTGDFGYGCNFGELSCRNNLEAIYAMCRAGLFQKCVNETSSMSSTNLSV